MARLRRISWEPGANASAFSKRGRAACGRLRSTSSVPHPTNAIPLDGLLADALRNEVTS